MPASKAEIAAIAAKMLDTLVAAKGNTAEALMNAYAGSLDEFEAIDIDAAVRRLLKGKIDGASLKFLPTGPELFVYVDRVRAERMQMLTGKPASSRVTLSQPVQHVSVEGEQARMRLKMPMLQYAEGNSGRMFALKVANQEGLQSMIVLASSWGVDTPKELEDHIAEVGLKEAEKLWRKARKSAWQGIEESPPPFLVTRKKMLEKWGAFPVLEDDVSYDRWLSKKGKWPVGATWVSALGTVYLDTRMKGAGGMA
jgi:hypothetical protein